MICSNCKKEVTGNKSICLYCGSVIKKNVKAKQPGSTKTSKGVKNKYIKEDQAALVGSEVTKKNGSFIRIERRVKKDVPVERKNYVNYIDYQEAKAATNNKRYIGESKSILGKFLNTSNNSSDNDSTMVSLDKASRDSRRALELDKNMLEQRVSEAEKRTNSRNLIELRSVPKKDNRISNPEIMRADDPEYDLINKMFEVEQERVINLSFLPYLLLILLWIGIIGFMIISKNDDYYFSEDDNRIAKENIDKDSSGEDMNDYQGTSKSGQDGNTSSDGFTSIVYDNQYFEQFTIKDLNDVVNLIESDSLKQKSKCPSSIVAIENDIINNYDVVAVNLCEMDYDFAKELRDVVKYVYDNYPSARDYLTNLTLANV